MAQLKPPAERTTQSAANHQGDRRADHEGELQAARSTAAFRAAVWFLGLSAILLVVYVVSLCSGFLRNKPALDTGLLAAVVITSAINMFLFHRTHLPFFKGDRRTTAAIWKDVCWLTHR